MKKLIYKITSGIVGALLLVGCSDFGDINIDPNHPSEANTQMLFSYSLRYVPYFVMERSYNPQFLLYPRYIAERQNVQYGRYNINDFSTTNYYRYILMDLHKIITLNEDPSTRNTTAVSTFGSSNNQIAVARTLSDYYFLSLTDILGMIPYSDALKGDSGIYQPKLDTQEEVYTGVINDLQEAYNQFDESGSLNSSYDYIYKGNITKWKKLNATLRMMAAIKLSDVAPDKGKTWFQKAYQDGGITENGDNFVYDYYGNSDNENPLYTNIVTEGRRDFAPCKDLVDLMNNLQDPRRAAYFTTNANGEYKGIPLGILSSQVQNYNKDNSGFNEHMYEQGSDVIILSAARTLLVEAEAAVRGWIDADAETLYNEGIRLSIEAKFALNNAGAVPSDDAITTYLNEDGVKFTGSDTEKIRLIATQRWINGYFEDGVEAWSDWRRLDAPTLTIGPEALVKHIPYRAIYASDDVSTNTANYEAAYQQQGENTVDTRVWWDVTDNADQPKE